MITRANSLPKKCHRSFISISKNLTIVALTMAKMIDKKLNFDFEERWSCLVISGSVSGFFGFQSSRFEKIVSSKFTSLLNNFLELDHAHLDDQCLLVASSDELMRLFSPLVVKAVLIQIWSPLKDLQHQFSWWLSILLIIFFFCSVYDSDKVAIWITNIPF